MPAPAPNEPDAARHNRALGLRLFAVYSLLYFAFIAAAAYDYRILATPLLPGVNLAVGWGVLLILAAIGLAFLYASRAKPDEPIDPEI